MRYYLVLANTARVVVGPSLSWARNNKNTSYFHRDAYCHFPELSLGLRVAPSDRRESGQQSTRDQCFDFPFFTSLELCLNLTSKDVNIISASIPIHFHLFQRPSQVKMTRNRVPPVNVLREVLRDPAAVAVLQHSPQTGPAVCAAKDECIERSSTRDGRTGREIESFTRIHIGNVPRRDPLGRPTGVMRQILYYHPTCFESLMEGDLAPLIPQKLRLDGYGWGFMVRKWWQQRGVIDIASISGYLTDCQDQELRAQLGDVLWVPPGDVWHRSDHDMCVPNVRCEEPVPVCEWGPLL